MPVQTPDSLTKRYPPTLSTARSGQSTIESLHFSIFDMAIHEPASYKEVKERNTSKIFNSLRKDISGLDGPEVLDGGHDWGHYPASTDQLMGGYTAGLYFYLK
jgi:metallopeptidase MepB